jgi:hypothetical protein
MVRVGQESGLANIARRATQCKYEESNGEGGELFFSLLCLLRNDVVQLSFLDANFDDFNFVIIQGRVGGRGRSGDESRRVRRGGRRNIY